MELIDKQVTIDWLKKVTVTEGITFEAGFKQIIYDIEQMPCVEVRHEKENMSFIGAIAHLEDLQRMYLGNEKFKRDIKALDMAIKALRLQDAPTYEARPISRWLRKIDRDSKDTYFECVQCEKDSRYRYRYCPNCGARMEDKE